MQHLDEAPVAAAVGKGADYYLPRFRQFMAGRWLSWNWAAFAATLAWLRYRKLHAWSWLYAFASLPFLAWWLPSDRPEACIGTGNESQAIVAVALVALAVLLVPPLVANRLYYDHIQKLVRTAPDQVASKGGTGSIAGALVLQAVVLALALVALPDMKYYLVRAQIHEGVALARAAAADVQRYRTQHGGQLPARLGDATRSVSSTYARLELTPQGAIRAVFNETARPIGGRSVAMVPTSKPGEAAAYSCVSTDIVDRCLPQQCKGR